MSKLSTEQRNQLTDSDFGIPEKRMYPLHDKAHVESAVKLFGHAETKYKKSLARKILSRAREYGMDTSGWKQVLTFAQEQVPPMSNGTSIGNSPPRLMAPYYDEQDELLERVNDLDGAVDPFVFAKRIVSTIHDQVEKDSKPPTGNQNCQLCTWCAEAWYRNMQVLPRPVYSPRDPALEIKGETIVANPIKKRFSSQREVVETVRGNIDSRWYVHVNWKDSTGGHEFLVVNIKDYAYIMDAQAGLLKEIDETDSTNSYFRDINFDNSYMVRLDDKPFNTRLFNEMNDPAKVLPWNPELDVPYMKEHDMLGDMSDKWTMRPATEADLEFVYFSELETVGENKNDPKVQKYIREDAKESLGHTQIIVAENSDIGVYQAYATDYYGLREGKKDWWYLAHIYIKPEYRTLGIGSAIIKRDIAEHDKILLQVMKSNTRAKKLYESLGFVVDMENDHGGLVMRLDKSKSKAAQESFMDEYEKRVNDKGDPVPEKCKCGGKISITLKGEPIYSCESCGKYYGTVPCNIQEGDIPKHDNTLIPVKDFPYDTVYRGSYDGHIDTNPLYVTPFKGLASIFAARDAIRPKLRELGLRVYNMDYDEWKLKPSELMKPFTTVHVKIQSKEGKTFEPFEIEATGDVYTFDVSNLKDKIYRYNWMDPDKEALVVDYGEIQMPKAERVTVKYIVEPDASFTQEGAFQDLKNGVNPYSDDLVFHVSPDKHIDGQVWQPRVPDYLDPYNPEDTGFEDNTTPRICFSTSIEGALNGITVNLQRQSPDTFDKMYVYVPEKPWKEYKHKTNKELVKNKLVYDANVTREVWIMEPVRMKLYGVIRVDQIADAKRKAVVPTSKGQKDKRNYFTYKWHWVVKPKVLKKATKFDYSPERVIDDLCVDVKKFKYGLIKDGRLMTGNVSDADYDKYWVFHSGETVDQAGGGNCYDMVEYEAGYLDAFGVPYKKYYMNFTDTKNTKTINTHTICVVPHNGKFIYIEQAFKRIVDEWGYERKKVFDKLTDIFEYVAEVTAEYENQDLNYGVWDYTNAEIDYGTPIKNFMEWIMSKCKMIHDGEATKPKPTKEGYRMNRFGRFYTEAKNEEELLSDDMEDITIGDLELDGDESDDTKDEKISIKDTNIDDDGSLPEEGDFDQYRDDDDDERIEKARGPIDDVPEYLKDRLSDDDLKDFEQPDENLNADNVDLGQFGKDQSDVQNDFDPKEVTILMKLMASEADAMNEYMDGAKETNVDVLRRLYADIANEERFHMEQLLFAKCELTGEQYQPKDPEVKSEYEELLKMGMDEETAMQTAVDKCHIRGSISEDDEDERMEIQADVETMEMTINMFNQLYDNVYTVMESGTPKEVDHAFEIFVEATYDATAASSAKSALSETKKFGPIQLIRTTLRFLVKTLMTIVRKFVSLCKRIHNRSREIKRFIKQYGFEAIFASKIKMYFVNFNNPYLVDDSLETLLALSVDTVNASLRSAGFAEMQQPYKRNPQMNIGGNVKRGIELLNGVQLVKSAMILPENEADRERIAEAFFGYSDQKGPDGKSVNTVNRMQWICDEWCRFMEYVDKITAQFDSLAQQQQSIYYTNKAKYDTAMKGLETVTKTCKAVVSAMQYDIETMIKLNNDAATQAANMSDTAAKDDQYNKQKQAYEQSQLVTTQCPFCGKTIKGQPNLVNQELMKHVKTSHADIPDAEWVLNNMRKKNKS